MGAPVILITGALTGIGRATAFAFAKEGATVVASGRHEAEGKALEAALRSPKHDLRVTQAQGSGSIINMSSTMGERCAANLALYTASKHAVEGLTKSAALEAAPLGVRVNAVAPGPTETAMLDRLTGTPDKKAAFYAAIPLKRGAEPEEIADAIVFLASDKASFVTGQIIRVNGGKTAT